MFEFLALFEGPSGILVGIVGWEDAVVFVVVLVKILEFSFVGTSEVSPARSDFYHEGGHFVDNQTVIIDIIHDKFKV